MTLKKIPFQAYTPEEQRKGRSVTVYLNQVEYEQLWEDMLLLRQAKDSTALKQLWQLGRNLAHDTKTGFVLRTVLRNVELNKLSGVVLREPKKDRNLAENSEKSRGFQDEGLMK